jgi:hypothetical protein
MAFPTGWVRKCPLTIQKTKVPADLTDFPVLFTVADLPSEMFDADGSYPARADGGDIRFSSDSAGATPLPVEVYYFLRDNNPALGKAEIHVKVAAVSSSVNTVIYVWYNAPAETMPARNATYGSDNVWDSHFKFVCHNGASIGDSTSAAVAGTNHSTTDDATESKIGVSSRKFVAASSQYIDWGNIVNLNGASQSITIDLTVKPNSPVNDPFIFGRKAQFWIEYLGANLGNWCLSGTSNNFSLPNLAWAVDTFVYDRGIPDLYEYINGVKDGGTDAGNIIPSTSNYLQEGVDYGGTLYMDGWIDEARISDNVRSAAWIVATYNTLASPATFVSVGTPESGGGARIFDFAPFFAE